MTSGREGSSGGGSGDKPRRPQPPILDLKPTRVTVEPPAETASASEPAKEPETTAVTQPTEPAPGDASPKSESPVAAETGEPVAAAGEPKDRSEPPAPPVDDDPSPSASVAENEGAKADQPDPTGPAVPPPAEPTTQPWRIAAFALAAGAGAAAGALALLLVASIFGIPLGGAARLDQAAERINVLESRVRDLAARPLPAPDERIDGLLKRVAAGERALQRVAALETRMDAIEAQLKRIGSSPSPAADGNARVDAVEEQAKTLAASVAEIRRRLDEVGKQATGASGAAVQDIEELTKRVAGLEAATKEIQAALAKPDAPDRDGAARRAAAMIALRSSVEGGAPFAGALATLKALTPNDKRLAALEPFADSGIPSLPALRQELAGVIPKAEPEPTPRTDAGWLDRLQSGFSRLVRVRPADEASTSRGVFAPVQAALARGDLEAALAAAAALPESARAPLDAWLKKAQGRLAALKTVRDLSQESLAALAAPEKEPVRQ